MVVFKPALKTIGHLLIILAFVMTWPAVADYSVGNPDWQTFIASAALTFFVGGLGVAVTGGPIGQITRRQAFITTVVTWVVICAFGALPFLLSEQNMGMTDAVFETMSGLTTTGSTVMTGLDFMPPGILLWRSLLQWIGGVGMVVMGIALLPFLRIGGMQIFRTESSDTSEKLVPRMRDLALRISGLYAALTAACALGFWMFGMSAFEAVNHAMATLSTGGFSTSDQSFAKFENAAIHWTAVLFMIAGGLPFTVFLRAAAQRRLKGFADPQIRLYLGGLACVWGAFAIWQVAALGTGAFEALTLAAFNVTSVVTTTGFASADYIQWGAPAVVGFYLLTFVGGCSGSTAGGLKIYRLVLMAKAWQHIGNRMIHPHAVYPVSYAGNTVPPSVIASVLSFCLVYVGTILGLALIMAFLGLDVETSLSGAATAVANVGPGVSSLIGPVGNFATLPDAAKWTLVAGMMLGRLELLTVFVILTPAFWRD